METDTVVADIAARLARLEKSNRRLRLTLVAVVVAASSLALVAAGRQDSKPVADEVRAKRIVVVDSDGVVRGAFGSDRFGQPSLELFDSNGKPGLAMASNRGGGASLTMKSDLGVIVLGVVGEDSRRKLNFMDGLLAEPNAPEADVPSALLSFTIRNREAARIAVWAAKSCVSLGREIHLVAPSIEESSLALADRVNRTRRIKEVQSPSSTESRPKCSIVMFGPDGSVIEKLPR